MPKKLTGNSSNETDMALIELPIGGVCRVNGRQVVCVLGNNCKHCFFKKAHSDCEGYDYTIMCRKEARLDEQDVYFLEVKG